MTAEKAQQTRARASKTIYDQRTELFNRKIEQGKKGKRLIKAKDVPFEQNRHGLIRWYVHDEVLGLAADTLTLFVNEIRSHGGRHAHQGGVSLFILKGKGYSVVDGVRYDWEPGDLVMLPIKRGGCDHQHFNLDNKPSRWLALRNRPLMYVVGNFREQKEEHPDWKE